MVEKNLSLPHLKNFAINKKLLLNIYLYISIKKINWPSKNEKY